MPGRSRKAIRRSDDLVGTKAQKLEAALREGRRTAVRRPSTRGRNVGARGRNSANEDAHQPDREPFARTAVRDVVFTSALRDQRSEIVGPANEALRPEGVGVFPGTGVPAGVVKVENRLVPAAIFAPFHSVADTAQAATAGKKGKVRRPFRTRTGTSHRTLPRQRGCRCSAWQGRSHGPRRRQRVDARSAARSPRHIRASALPKHHAGRRTWPSRQTVPDPPCLAPTGSARDPGRRAFPVLPALEMLRSRRHESKANQVW